MAYKAYYRLEVSQHKKSYFLILNISEIAKLYYCNILFLKMKKT